AGTRGNRGGRGGATGTAGRQCPERARRGAGGAREPRGQGRTARGTEVALGPPLNRLFRTRMRGGGRPDELRPHRGRRPVYASFGYGRAAWRAIFKENPCGNPLLAMELTRPDVIPTLIAGTRDGSSFGCSCAVWHHRRLRPR